MTNTEEIRKIIKDWRELYEAASEWRHLHHGDTNSKWNWMEENRIRQKVFNEMCEEIETLCELEAHGKR